MQIFLKVDVDTKRGFQRGVPNLLEMFKQLGITASFYVSMGPDNSGRAIRRIFRPGFLAKMRRTNAVGTYGFPTLLYGVLWPAPMISLSDPGMLLRIVQNGHELGIHGYDHVLWHDMLDIMEPAAISRQVDKALEIYRHVLRKDPLGFAAPGWKWNRKTQEIFASAPFMYTSNSRGVEPYFPVLEGSVYEKLEIPTTLPTLDEVLGEKADTPDELSSFFLKKFHHHSAHVFTLHAELEGMGYSGWFRRLLQMLRDEGAVFHPLRDMAQEVLRTQENIPRSDMVHGPIDGRATEVALQGLTSRLPVAG